MGNILQYLLQEMEISHYIFDYCWASFISDYSLCLWIIPLIIAPFLGIIQIDNSEIEVIQLSELSINRLNIEN